MVTYTETELIELAQNGTEAQRTSAEAKLIAMHSKYVYKVTWYHYSRLPKSAHRIDLEDIAQVVRIGLIIGIRKFDSTKKVKLLTYATHWMNLEAQRMIQWNANTIRVPIWHKKEIDWSFVNARSIDSLNEDLGDAWNPGVLDPMDYDQSQLSHKLSKVFKQMDYHKELYVLLRNDGMIALAKELGVTHELCERCGKRPNWKQAARDRAYARFMELCEQEGVAKEDFLDFLRDA